MARQYRTCYSWKPAPTTWLSLLLLVLLFPVGLSLPGWWGWENGPLENTQVFILGIGCLLSFFAARYNRNNRKARNLWLWSAPYWLLCIGRELSWGRVFYPISIGPQGPEFISIHQFHQLWYGPFIYPFIAIVIVATLVGIYRSSPLEYIKQTTLPLLDIAVLLIAIILASWFDKGTLPLFHHSEEVLEEWAELTAYWSMVSIAAVSGFTKSAKNSLNQVKRLSVIKRL